MRTARITIETEGMVDYKDFQFYDPSDIDWNPKIIESLEAIYEINKKGKTEED